MILFLGKAKEIKKSPFFRKMKLIFLNRGSFMKITAHISARMLITFLFSCFGAENPHPKQETVPFP
ncbi:hypothetical protein BSM4216_0408 [Bacillus smithii]|nr:hypothetical protein BSM4216_0408 [Bacillus smithii]